MGAKWLAVKKIKLDTIVLPGGFARRKREQHVADLAESIKRGGVISLPVVDAKTRKLVAGGDRLAALQLLKVTQHEVRMVTGTENELEAITIEENLWRRRGDDYDGMTKRLIQLAVAEGREIPATLTGKSDIDDEPARPVGRPKTDHGRAREEVAAKLGKTPEAIRQAEKRARQKEEAAKEEETPEEVRIAENPPVTTYGVALGLEFARAIKAVQVLIDDADKQLRAAQRAITALKSQGSLGSPLASRMQAEVHRAADAVRRERPDSVCPCCKLIPALQLKCTFCGGVGVVSNEKASACAPELLVSGPKAMVVSARGGLVPYDRESAAPTEKAKPAKGAKKIRIEDDRGNELPIDDVPSMDVNEEDEGLAF